MLCFLLKSENDAHYAKVTKQADADFYFAQKTAEANKVCVCERERERVCERECALHAPALAGLDRWLKHCHYECTYWRGK